MNTLEILQKFCATDDNRKSLYAPFRFDGFIYATDRSIAIRMPDDGSKVVGIDPKIKKIKSFFTDIHSAKFIEIPPLPERETCIQCGGIGKVNFALLHCDECDGEGTFEHGSHDYECKECNGSGEVKTRTNGNTNTCDKCNGDGKTLIQPIKIGDTHVNLKYLELIAGLPNCVSAPAGPNNKVFFRFDGGEGIVMPVRV